MALVKRRRLVVLAPLAALFTGLLLHPLGCGGNGGGGGTEPTSSYIKADHTTLDISAIQQASLDQARALRMSLSHASVGGNVWAGLSTLQATDSVRYSFPHWSSNNRGNPGWQAKVDDFDTWVANQGASFDVFQMKFCYIDQEAPFTYYRDHMLALENAYPSKTFVWWTMPITTSGSDNALRAAFNNQVRAYCASNDKILYDIAAIESHDASGNPVTSDGNEAMAAGWSSDGGHLSASGEDRAAKAMWWLMARVAGWDGN